MDTVDNSETGSTDFIKITENPLNMFKNQLILKNGERRSYNKNILFKRKIREVINLVPVSNVLELMREKIPQKGLLVIYCSDDNLFLRFQDMYNRYTGKYVRKSRYYYIFSSWIVAKIYFYYPIEFFLC